MGTFGGNERRNPFLQKSLNRLCFFKLKMDGHGRDMGLILRRDADKIFHGCDQGCFGFSGPLDQGSEVGSLVGVMVRKRPLSDHCTSLVAQGIKEFRGVCDA